MGDRTPNEVRPSLRKTRKTSLAEPDAATCVGVSTSEDMIRLLVTPQQKRQDPRIEAAIIPDHPTCRPLRQEADS
jgi:hypothetical protein